MLQIYLFILLVTKIFDINLVLSQGAIKRIVNGLQRMIDCKDVSEGTIAWDRTHELLQIARDAIEEEETRGGHRV